MKYFQQKKIFSAIYIASTLILTACGGGDSSNSSPNEYTITGTNAPLSPGDSTQLGVEQTRNSLTSSSSSSKAQFSISGPGRQYTILNGSNLKLKDDFPLLDKSSVHIKASMNGSVVAESDVALYPHMIDPQNIPKFEGKGQRSGDVSLVFRDNQNSFKDGTAFFTQDTNLENQGAWGPDENSGTGLLEAYDLRTVTLFNVNLKDNKITNDMIFKLKGHFRNQHYNTFTQEVTPRTDGLYNCLLIQYANFQKVQNIDEPINLQELLNQSQRQQTFNEGMHITATPFHDSNQCSKDDFLSKSITADPYDMFVININGAENQIKPDNTYSCVIKGNDVSQCPNYENPHFEVDSNDHIHLVGSLYNWFKNHQNQDNNNPFHIRVETGSQGEASNIVLNSDYHDYAPDIMASSDCKNAINDWKKDKGVVLPWSKLETYFSNVSNKCQLQETLDHKSGMSTYTTTHQIIVDGHGILTQPLFEMSDKYGQMGTDSKWVNTDGTDKDHDMEQVALVLYTDQLALSSQYTPKPAIHSYTRYANDPINRTELKNNASIDVSGITVANGYSRNESNVRLNYQENNDPNNYLDPDTRNDYPVYLHDFTQIGNWLGQTDAAAVAGRYSTIENTLYQVADDNIKTMAEGESFKDMTLISGADGLPIDLGQYGFNRGQSHINIDGVYIVRMNQDSDNDIVQKGQTKEWEEEQGIIGTHSTNYGMGLWQNYMGDFDGVSDTKSKNSNSINENFYQRHTYNYWSKINISHVSKLSTPEDYSMCARVYVLDLPDVNNPPPPDEPEYQNDALGEMLFGDVNLTDIPNDNWCYHPSFKSNQQVQNTKMVIDQQS
ncbi:hypothetical protein CF386_10470 [Paraphotobacterium marinum]|uniref:Lipoprotein n=1 Tax=Paraphotobacterium marinum TaxID=1755811 RepID=A0A220VGI1_9GAMM|nr:hypothetical protein [Paraphotobacterium marinum]ASK79475.1 hypothetical protein CF386_10470 [Paraphotobacterium marinum]